MHLSYALCRSIAWELPGNIPYEAKTRLINQFTTLWLAPAEKCLASINDVLDDVIQQLVKTHFGRFSILQDKISYVKITLSRRLMQTILYRGFIRPDIEDHKNRALAAVKETLALEITPIYTQNLKDFETLRGRWLNKYRKARQKPGEYRIRTTHPKVGGGKKNPIKKERTVLVNSTQGTDNDASPEERTVALPNEPLVTQGWSMFSPAVPEITSSETQALHYLAQAGYGGLTVDDLARLYPRDHQFEDELVVMADVRAYFTLAYKVRVILGADAVRG